jgi:hypothetical protein
MAEETYTHFWENPKINEEWAPVVQACNATRQRYGGANDHAEVPRACGLIALHFPASVARLASYTTHGRYESIDLEVRVGGIFPMIMRPGDDASHVCIAFAALLGPHHVLAYRHAAEKVPMDAFVPFLKDRLQAPAYPQVNLTTQLKLHMSDRVWARYEEERRWEYEIPDDYEI